MFQPFIFKVIIHIVGLMSIIIQFLLFFKLFDFFFLPLVVLIILHDSNESRNHWKYFEIFYLSKNITWQKWSVANATYIRKEGNLKLII